MKQQRTIQYFFGVAVSVMVLYGSLWAQTPGVSFLDDFSDGDPADGAPVNWVPNAGPDPGGYGYVLTPEGLDADGAIASDLDGSYYMYRDVSVTVQIKRISDHTNGQWVSGFACRWTDGATGGYWIEVNPPNHFWFGHRDRYILRSADLPFNVDEQELIIRVDAVGDQLKAWCWPAGEPMPETPQISFVDDVAPEGTIALYASNTGGQAIYRSVEVVSLDIPVVDFNGDGQVEMEDLLKMIDCWGQNESSVDLYADGTVDAKDLEILMDYWQQNVNDLTLLAHWPLDEIEGDIACDSTGIYNAVLLGEAVWDPDGGYVNGALQLDGVDDYVAAPFVLSPADGPFSVLAWVRGGAPGQTLISQDSGANWLLVGPTDGCLMTELQSTDGRVAGCALASQTVISDGQWHRVALTCDGTNRTLYVDDTLVAEDAQAALGNCSGGLNIGCGTNRAPGTFFSGLIDDIRIYNRAIRP